MNETTIPLDSEAAPRQRRLFWRLIVGLIVTMADGCGVFVVGVYRAGDPRQKITISADRFSDKALIYRSTDQTFSLYSIGPNLTDDGGRSWRDGDAFDDLSLQVHSPSLKAGSGP